MARASRMVRKLRRVRRERTLAYRGMDLAMKQRDQARFVAGALEAELKKYADKVSPDADPDNFYPEGEDTTPIQAAPVEERPALTITRIEEPDV